MVRNTGLGKDGLTGDIRGIFKGRSSITKTLFLSMHILHTLQSVYLRKSIPARKAMPFKAEEFLTNIPLVE